MRHSRHSPPPSHLRPPISLPVPLHVTSSRKVHRSAYGTLNIVQEISCYAEGGVKSPAEKQLKEVHAHSDDKVHGSFPNETKARVFAGTRIIRIHIETAIRPNSSESLEIDEVFHFAENDEVLVMPIAFETHLEPVEDNLPAAEFDLSSTLVVTCLQRIFKVAAEQYKVLHAIELRAKGSEARPTQELTRQSTTAQRFFNSRFEEYQDHRKSIAQPTTDWRTDSAQFGERIFAGSNVLRVDNDVILVVCDPPFLMLAESRVYAPSRPLALPSRCPEPLTESAPLALPQPPPQRVSPPATSATKERYAQGCIVIASCPNLRLARITKAYLESREGFRASYQYRGTGTTIMISAQYMKIAMALPLAGATIKHGRSVAGVVQFPKIESEEAPNCEGKTSLTLLNVPPCLWNSEPAIQALLRPYKPVSTTKVNNELRVSFAGTGEAQLAAKALHMQHICNGLLVVTA